MRWRIKKHDKLLWVLVILIVFPGTSFSEPGFDRPSLHSRQSLILPEIWVGGGLSYFPFYMQPLPIYPDVQWLYPCFPFASCMALQQYRSDERRKKRSQPKPVFGQGASPVDEAMEAWRAGLRPATEPFRTDEQLIVPAFRGHSLIRPEYQKAGSLLPEFSANERNENAEHDENEWPDEQ